MVSGQQTGGLAGKTDHLICQRRSIRRVSPLAYIKHFFVYMLGTNSRVYRL